MGKKGKKGKGGGKGKKGKKGEKCSPAEAFLNVRIKIFKKSINETKNEINELTKQLIEMNDVVDEEDASKNSVIKNCLTNLHQAGKQLEDKLIDREEVEENKKIELVNRTEARNDAEMRNREQLALELKANRELEAEVQKWKDYRDKDHEVDDNEIADLENQISIHNSNTDKMREFILKLIETGKHEAESMLEALNVKHRDNAFLDAIKNTSPGALYECRESEKLEQWVADQTIFVENESKIICDLQTENLRLISVLEQLKKDRFDFAPKDKLVLETRFFDAQKPIRLPKIPKIELKGTTPPLMSVKSFEKLSGIDN